MLNIYQRPEEQTRPLIHYSTKTAQGAEVNLITTEDGAVYEAVEIEISDGESSTSVFVSRNLAAVFVSLRPGPAGTAPETCLSIPDAEPGIYAEQLAAAQLESALAATEAAAAPYRDSLRLQFGLVEFGQPAAGPRALRPARSGPEGSLSVCVRYADGARELFSLSPECPALYLDPEKKTYALALSPVLWAADLFLSAAETWKSCSKKTRKRLCFEYGIDMQQFLKREEEYKKNLS